MIRLSLAASLICLAVGCAEPRSSVVSTPTRGWSTAREVTLENTDSIDLRQIAFVVRYTSAADTLRLVVRTLTPDSLCFEEPVELILKQPRKPAALTSETLIPYRKVLFRRRGLYCFRFTPAQPVDGVEAIGMQIN